jgi:hypothetical protein
VNSARGVARLPAHIRQLAIGGMRDGYYAKTGNFTSKGRQGGQAVIPGQYGPLVVHSVVGLQVRRNERLRRPFRNKLVNFLRPATLTLMGNYQ